jgi:hypothetical protein
VGTSGIWIEDDWDFTAGTLNIGPTTIAGLPAGILSVVGDLCAVIINDRAWTAAERAGVIAWGKARGAPGVFELGPELVTNGTFDTDTAGWTGSNATLAYSAGTCEITSTANLQARAQQILTVETGSSYLIGGTVWRGTTTQAVTILLSGVVNSVSVTTTTPTNLAFFVTAPSTTFDLRPGTSGATPIGETAYCDNISVRKLELIP